ncbi:MAG: response regulator [Clostridiales bacterium]|nr:response regulator [Clostridiales bacterium]
MKKLKILIIDDAFFMRMLLKKTLSNKEKGEFEFEVVAEAENGQEGLDLYKLCNADIVTLDINMPKLNGLEFLKKVRSINPNVKCIIISTTKNEKVRKEINNKNTYYLPKSFQPEYFYTLLDEIALSIFSKPVKNTEIPEIVKEENSKQNTKETVKEDIKKVEVKKEVKPIGTNKSNKNNKSNSNKPKKLNKEKNNKLKEKQKNEFDDFSNLVVGAIVDSIPKRNEKTTIKKENYVHKNNKNPSTITPIDSKDSKPIEIKSEGKIKKEVIDIKNPKEEANLNKLENNEIIIDEVEKVEKVEVVAIEEEKEEVIVEEKEIEVEKFKEETIIETFNSEDILKEETETEELFTIDGIEDNLTIDDIEDSFVIDDIKDNPIVDDVEDSFTIDDIEDNFTIDEEEKTLDSFTLEDEEVSNLEDENKDNKENDVFCIEDNVNKEETVEIEESEEDFLLKDITYDYEKEMKNLQEVKNNEELEEFSLLIKNKKEIEENNEVKENESKDEELSELDKDLLMLKENFELNFDIDLEKKEDSSKKIEGSSLKMELNEGVLSYNKDININKQTNIIIPPPKKNIEELYSNRNNNLKLKKESKEDLNLNKTKKSGKKKRRSLLDIIFRRNKK